MCMLCMLMYRQIGSKLLIWKELVTNSENYMADSVLMGRDLKKGELGAIPRVLSVDGGKSNVQ